MAPSACPMAAPVITLPKGFQLRSVDDKLGRKVPEGKRQNPLDSADGTEEPPLGVLSNFQGTFQGTGLNLIFRPNSIPPFAVPQENVLQINLTTESLAFSNPLGSTPNRGLQEQPDIFLNGVPYLQTVNDVTNTETGKADATPTPIHFEPGLWMHVPATSVDPDVPDSLSRMGSIPHGTVINAQAFEPKTPISGAPDFTLDFNIVDPTPFVIGQPTNKIKFAAQTAATPSTIRIPPDLTNFIAQGTITQEILDNPNLVLKNAIVGQNILSFFVFTVDTKPRQVDLGGGIANIAFLEGDVQAASGQTQVGPNADAADMNATFWIETVQYTITVPPMKVGDAPITRSPDPNVPGAPVPVFSVSPPRDITEDTQITVTSTQIQYSQVVALNFAGLTWPHVSVATLVPQAAQVVPASAFPA